MNPFGPGEPAGSGSSAVWTPARRILCSWVVSVHTLGSPQFEFRPVGELDERMAGFDPDVWKVAKFCCLISSRWFLRAFSSGGNLRVWNGVLIQTRGGFSLIRRNRLHSEHRMKAEIRWETKNWQRISSSFHTSESQNPGPDVTQRSHSGPGSSGCDEEAPNSFVLHSSFESGSDG